jgi:hypothetical protein
MVMCLVGATSTGRGGQGRVAVPKPTLTGLSLRTCHSPPPNLETPWWQHPAAAGVCQPKRTAPESEAPRECGRDTRRKGRVMTRKRLTILFAFHSQPSFPAPLRVLRLQVAE